MTREQLLADGWTAVESGLPSGPTPHRHAYLLLESYRDDDGNEDPDVVVSLGEWWPNADTVNNLPDSSGFRVCHYFGGENPTRVNGEFRRLRYWKPLPDFNS